MVLNNVADDKLDGKTISMTALLDIINLKKSFGIERGQRSMVLRGITLKIEKGQIVGLIGESGCGKSTLARCILGLESADAGQISFAGQVISGLSPSAFRSYRQQMQMIFQDPFSSLNPRMRIETIITEPLVVNGLVRDRKNRKCAAEELLQKVDLSPDTLQRFPHEFSGGQRQRIAIARALAGQPRLIVADEPVSALDILNQYQIIKLLIHLQQTMGLSYLFITHDLRLALSFCHQVAVMHQGTIIEQTPTDEFIRSPKHPYSHTLLDSLAALGHC